MLFAASAAEIGGRNRPECAQMNDSSPCHAQHSCLNRSPHPAAPEMVWKKSFTVITSLHHVRNLDLDSFTQSKIPHDTWHRHTQLISWSIWGGFQSHWALRFWCCSCTGKIGLNRRGSTQRSAEIASTRPSSQRWHRMSDACLSTLFHLVLELRHYTPKH